MGESKMKAILKTEDLKRLIKGTVKFVSKEERKYILQYVQLKFSKDEMTVTAIALNGYMLSVETVKCYNLDESFTAYIRPHLPVGAKCEYSTIEMSGENCLIDIDGRIVGYKQPDGEFFNSDKFLYETEHLPVIAEIALTKDFLIDAIKSLQQDELKKSPVVIQIRNGLQPVSVQMGKSTRHILPVRRK
jgi:DNA polymerase III sliding clamp (beta) subunit (PCNA family)